MRCNADNGHHIIAQVIVYHVVVVWRGDCDSAAATIPTQAAPMRVLVQVGRIRAKVTATAVPFIHLLVVYVHSGHKIVFDARWVQSGRRGRYIGLWR